MTLRLSRAMTTLSRIPIDSSFTRFLSVHSHRIITYLTDVEGDKAYLERYVHQSKVLHLIEYKSKDLPYDWCIDFKDNHGELIFGGDIWDKGGHDLFCIRQLLDLKRRYPHRVHFIMGNRDLNKLRILNELGIDQMPQHHGVCYLTGTGTPGDPLLPHAGISQTCPIQRLQWILTHTMGSPQAFQLRKLELESENEKADRPGTVTDDDVVQSYRQSCHPKGEMGQYLHQAHLAFQLGALFVVHGALPLTPEVLQSADVSLYNNMEFAMPWRDSITEQEPAPTNVLDWIKSTKLFAEAELLNWTASIAELEKSAGLPGDGIWAEQGDYHFPPTRVNSYCNLMQYGYGWTPNGKRNRTVVYSSWQTKGMPRRFFTGPNNTKDAPTSTFARMTSQFFDEANVQLILSGHQPSGDMPTPIRVDTNKMILCCDTSYSGDTVWINDTSSGALRSNPGRGITMSGRGDLAVSEVLVEQCRRTGDIISVELHGVLSDGSKYEMKNVMSDDRVGQLMPAVSPVINEKTTLPINWWVKAKLGDGHDESFLLSSGEGYKVWNRILSKASIDEGRCWNSAPGRETSSGAYRESSV